MCTCCNLREDLGVDVSERSRTVEQEKRCDDQKEEQR